MKAPTAVGLCRDGNHRYYWAGEQIPVSVTGVLGVIAKGGLVPWAAKQVAEYAVANADLFTTMLERGDRDGAIRWLKGEPFAKRDKAADLGTRVHALAEAIATGQDVTVAEDEAPFVNAYLAWREATQPHYRLVEEMVANLQHGYAGTFDAMALIDGNLWLLDYKTSSGTYAETALQLAAYANAEFIGKPGDPKRYRLPKPTRYGVVHIRPEGAELVEYHVTDFEWHAFLAALRLSQWVNGRAKAVKGKEEAWAA